MGSTQLYNRPLLGIQWQGGTYVNGMLPFGLRSALKIFTAVADALEWCIREAGVSEVDHYLDDFVTLGPVESQMCRCNLDTIISVCRQLGIPVGDGEVGRPIFMNRVLGIIIDTVNQKVRLPTDKLARLHHMTRRWVSRRSCCRRDLESLVGILNHAASVIRPSRSFLRGMFDLRSRRRGALQFIRLNQQFQADLSWWRAFAADWIGRALLLHQTVDPMEFASDASGS